MAEYIARPEPINLELPFTADEAVTTVAGFDRWQLLGTMTQAVHGSTLATDSTIRGLALRLQQHIEMPDEALKDLILEGGEAVDTEQQEILDLHRYGDGLVVIRECVTSQTLRTDTQREVDDNAQSKFDPRYEKVTVNPIIEAAIRRSHQRFGKLLGYYSLNGLVIPDRADLVYQEAQARLYARREAKHRRTPHIHDTASAQDLRELQETYFAYNGSDQGQIDKARIRIINQFFQMFSPPQHLIPIERLLGADMGSYRDDGIS